MKLKLYLIPLAVVLACVVMSGIVKSSYKDMGSEVYGYEISGSGEWDAVFKAAGVQSAQDLIDQSDLIVRAQYNGQRLIRGTGFYSTVHISEVYKGSPEMKGKDIIVTESIVVFSTTKYLNEMNMPMWIPLQKDAEYLMLLKNIPFVPERTLNEFQQSQYAPITSSPAGCYRIGGQVQTKLFNFEKEKTTLNDLKGYAIYATTQEDLNRYYQLQNEVFKKLNIS